jgi:hypothetical protein
MNNFCSHCGTPLTSESQYCSKCGTPVSNTNPVNIPNPAYQQGFTPGYHYSYGVLTDDALINEISKKVNTAATIWMVIGIIQLCVGTLYFLIYFLSGNIYSVIDYFTAGFLLVIGLININTSNKDRKFAKAILQSPIGILAKFKGLTSFIVTLIYNIFFGGLIGIIPSIYELVTRNFVMTHEKRLLDIEQKLTQPKSIVYI